MENAVILTAFCRCGTRRPCSPKRRSTMFDF